MKTVVFHMLSFSRGDKGVGFWLGASARSYGSRGLVTPEISRARRAGGRAGV